MFVIPVIGAFIENVRGIDVLRLHFTAEALARVRMRVTLGPIAESVFALNLFMGENNVAFRTWRAQVRGRLRHRVDAVERLAPSGRPLSDLLWLLDQASAEAPRTQAIARLSEFCRAAVLPYWRQAYSRMELEREARGRIVITKGVERMLSTLHPKVRWRSPVLEIPDERHLDVHLDARGLLLSPSLFLGDHPCVLVDANQRTAPPTLVYAIPRATTAIAMLCGMAQPNDHALAALVGQTRAAALRALAETCTTSELARRVNISSAGASQHATVLREAGLITTRRNRNTVLHTLTALGVALLQSERADVESPATVVFRPDRPG
ncbi:winged helix-turn-helix domain-containing protein [Actinophytocola sp. KF-1]